MKERERLRRLTTDAILLSLALVLAIVERWIPLDLLVPVPGLKLGLANIVSLLALVRLRPLDALAILVTRCLIIGSFTGLTALLFSLTGGLLALGIMWLLKFWEGRVFSLIGISLAGAAAHNIGQIAVAVLLLGEPRLFFTYLPPLLLTSLATGTLTGVAARPLVSRFPSLTSFTTSPPSQSTPPSQSSPPPSRPSCHLHQLLLIPLTFSLLLSGCAPAASLASSATGTSAAGEDLENNDWQKYSFAFTDTFDTPIDIIAYAPDQATFDQWAELAHTRFQQLHQVFDAYHEYAGLHNIATINAAAGRAPVQVPQNLLDLLVQVERWRRQWSDTVDLTLGPVLRIWEKARTAADAAWQSGQARIDLPAKSELATALTLCDTRRLIIDQAAGTVYLQQQGMVLDVGAVAKGYATEVVARELEAQGVTSMIINAGGSSVRLIGKPQPASRETWLIGIQNPAYVLPLPVADAGLAQTATPGADVPQTCATVAANQTSVATSGDYQRYFIQDGVIYHHILDPTTGWPVAACRGVTVVTPDSGLADFLSTALFILPVEKGRQLVATMPDVEALWILADGSQIKTAGFPSDDSPGAATS